MPKFLIERHVPGVGSLSERDFQAMAIKSNRVLEELGPSIQWQQSYVTDDALCCVYIAPNEEMIREHGRRGEFPVTRILRIQTMIDPSTGES